MTAMTRNASAAAVVLGLTVATLAQPPAATRKEAGADGDAAKAVVPFEMLPSNHMVVNAKLNGKGPYRLVFDLGAPITLLSNRAAEGSGTVKKDAPRSFLFSMRGEAEVGTLEVGGLKAKGLPVIVLDHPALKALGGFLGKPLDGIIGFTFFARYRTTIDYQANEMTFEPVDYRVKDLMKTLPDRLVGPKVERTRVLAPGALFGLTVGAPDDDLAAPGVSVTGVFEGSPAAEAGVKAGDVLTSLDGRWTATPADVYEAAAGAAPGRGVEAVVLRGGKELTLTVVPRLGL